MSRLLPVGGTVAGIARMTRVCARHSRNDRPDRCPVCRAYAKRREAELANLCIQCDVPMIPSSGGKRLCGKCGYVLACCDTV